MILEAIHSAISGVCEAYALIGDIEAETPFAVYNASPTPLRDKSGIVGYDYDVTVSLVSPDLDTVVNMSSGIISGVLALEDDMREGTSIDFAHFQGAEQRYDAVASVHVNDIKFRIVTENE